MITYRLIESETLSYILTNSTSYWWAVMFMSILSWAFQMLNSGSWTSVDNVPKLFAADTSNSCKRRNRMPPHIITSNPPTPPSHYRSRDPEQKGMEEVFEQIGAVSNSWGGLAIQWRELLYICFPSNLYTNNTITGYIIVMIMGLNIVKIDFAF